MHTSNFVTLKKYYIILNHCSIEICFPQIFWISNKFIHKLWPPELQTINTFSYIHRFPNLNVETSSLIEMPIEYAKYKFSKSDFIAVYKTLYLLL